MLRILFSIVAIVVLIVLVAFATPHISGFIKEHTGVYTALEERCTEKFQQQAGEEAGQSAESVFCSCRDFVPGKGDVLSAGEQCGSAGKYRYRPGNRPKDGGSDPVRTRYLRVTDFSGHSREAD